MDNGQLTGESDWNESWKNVEFYTLPRGDSIRQLIEHYIPHGGGKDCIEIGCFPGRILAVFGELGYKLNGVDFVDGVETAVPEWLAKQGYEIGIFEKRDFFELNCESKFDVVCSFGFIEHFQNWEEVLMKQASMVKGGGYLIVTAPNFAGFLQRTFLRLTDIKSFQKHYVPSINPKRWAEILAKDGYEILYCGYFEKFGYWLNTQELSRRQKAIVYIYDELISPLLRALPIFKQTSLYCGVVAKARSKS